jgi:hypothetical protein
MGKKQLYNAILFFSILCLVLFTVNFIVLHGVRHSESGMIGKVNQLMLHKIDPHIIIFGASEGEAGISSPRLAEKLQTPVFNMCLDGTIIHQYGDLVKEFNSYSKNGDYVILALGLFCLENRQKPTSLNSYYAWIHNKYISKNSFLDSMPEVRRYKAVPFYGFTLYNSDFYKASKEGWFHLLNLPVVDNIYDNKGWMPKDLLWGQNNSLSAEMPYGVFLYDEVFNKYRDVIADLNSKNRKVIMVFMPVWTGRPDYKGVDELKEKFRSLAVNGNILLDYVDGPLSGNRDNFYNYSHLNRKGAEAFTDTLAKDLARLTQTRQP